MSQDINYFLAVKNKDLDKASRMDIKKHSSKYEKKK